MPRRVTHLVIHHSASRTGSVAEFRRLHRAKGWQDIGYHAVIQPDGKVEMGRPETIDGAGVWGNNRGKLQICLIGQFSRKDANYTGTPTPAQYRALGEWLKSRKAIYGNPKVVGHKEITLPFHGTACPGDIPLNVIRDWYENSTLPFDVYLNGGAANLGKPTASPAEWTIVVNGKLVPAEMVAFEDGRNFLALEYLKGLGWDVQADSASKTVRVTVKP
jgi:N-acetylmuramoyl-L-alanine amidase